MADAATAPQCPSCGYDLTGTLEDPDRRCPECGRVWTIDELAWQQVRAQSGQRGAGRLLIWALGPGWVVAAMVFGAVLAGPPLMWGFLACAPIVAVGFIAAWAREINHRVQLAGRRRSRMGRFAPVIVGTSVLLLANVAEVLLAVWAISRLLGGWSQ